RVGSIGTRPCTYFFEGDQRSGGITAFVIRLCIHQQYVCEAKETPVMSAALVGALAGNGEWDIRLRVMHSWQTSAGSGNEVAAWCCCTCFQNGGIDPGVAGFEFVDQVLGGHIETPAGRRIGIGYALYL